MSEQKGGGDPEQGHDAVIIPEAQPPPEAAKAVRMGTSLPGDEGVARE